MQECILNIYNRTTYFCPYVTLLLVCLVSQADSVASSVGGKGF